MVVDEPAYGHEPANGHEPATASVAGSDMDVDMGVDMDVDVDVDMGETLTSYHRFGS